MNNRSRLQKRSQLPLAALFAALVLLAAGAANAQTWQRQAFGQGPMYIPGHAGDPSYAYYYPNNNNWSQEKVICYEHVNPPSNPYECQPSNWSTDTYPGHHTVGSDNAVIGGSGGPANLDRFASTDGSQSGGLSLNSLTIQPDGQLNMEYGSSVVANLYTFAGNDSTNALLSVGGGGGAAPVITIPAGGKMRKTTGTATFQLDASLVIQAINGGEVQCNAGALQLPGSSYYVGPSQPQLTPFQFNASSGALIDLAPAGAVDAGVVKLAGYINGINAGGVVRLNKGWLSTVADTGGATLNFAGDTFQWQGGAIRSQAADPFVNAGQINITGSASFLGVGFINKGLLVQSGPGQLIGPYGSGFTNAAEGTFDLRNDQPTVVNGGGGAAPFIHNYGTILKSAGSGTSILSKDMPIDSAGGTVRVDVGTLALGAGLASNYNIGDGSTFVVASGATLLLNDGSSHAGYNGTYTGSGGGTILLSGGEIESTVTGSGMTFNLPQGMFRWSGGSIIAAAARPFINAGYLSIVGPVNVGANEFTNTGTITQSDAASLNMPYGSSIRNKAGAIYDIQNDSSSTLNGGGGAGPIFNNEGLFKKSSGTGTSTMVATFNNSGTLLLQSGTLQFTDRLTQTDGVIDLSGGNLDSPNQDIFLEGGKIVGTGIINGNVRNDAGDMAPGHSPGKITINGNYSQAGNGTMTMEIGGTADGTYDQLVVSGTATLGGTLNIVAINGFAPKAGDKYTLISAANIAGSFSTVNVAGFTGRVDASATGITVTVLTTNRLLLNISTRMEVLTNENVLIGGFIVTGSDPKKVLIRGLGPELPVSGTLADPVLELHQGSTVLATNDNWRDTQEQAIKDTTIPPTNDLESAMVQTLQPGSYTAVLSGKAGGTGVGQVEVYDLASAAASQLANISTRGFVDTGDNVMIGGVIIGGGSAGTTAKVLVRAIGPSLAQQGVGDALQDPTLELRDGNGQLVAENDDWRSTQEQAINDTTIPPTDDRESAIVQTLSAGNYTAIVRGKGEMKGVGLVELYNLQ